MGSIVLLLIFIIVSIFIQIICKSHLKNGYKFLNPVTVLLLVWNYALIFHRYSFEPNENTAKVYALILLGIISCSVTFIASSKVTIRVKSNSELKNTLYVYDEKKLYRILLYFTLILFFNLLLSLYTIRTITQGNISLILTNSTYVRNLYLERNTGIVMSIIGIILSIHSMIGYVVLGIYCAKRLRKYKFFLLLWTIIAFAIAIITMSKMTFFIYILIVSTTFVNSSGTIKLQKKTMKRIVPIAGGVLVVLLVVMGIQRNYQTNGESMLEFTLKRAGFYFSSPIEALTIALQNSKSEYGLFKNTFFIFEKIFVRFGLINNVTITNHMDAVMTSRGYTNVYTWFYTYYQDLSLFGFVFYPAFFGLIAGLLYKSSEGSFSSIAANSFVCALFGMSFYSYLWGQGAYFYALIFAFIIDRVLFKNIYVEKV